MTSLEFKDLELADKAVFNYYLGRIPHHLGTDLHQPVHVAASLSAGLGRIERLPAHRVPAGIGHPLRSATHRTGR